jgi:D-lyxose ketol-isomerase
MKRSQINGLIEGAIALLERHRSYLPPFAYWSAVDWASKGESARMILERKLGWDVTDFGLDRFDEIGLVLFTLRNGPLADLARGSGMLYAEKVLIVDVGQVTPMHLHESKTEDIINRGGGQLAIQLYDATASDERGDSDVTFVTDGMQYTEPAGTILRLAPGSSITLPARMYHSFWAEGETVLAGEVSTVNDDEKDNHFLEPLGRFPVVEEDEPARYFLVSDYAAWLK